MGWKTFDYECNHCGNAFYELVSSPDEVVPCPECGGTTKRVLSVPHLATFSMADNATKGEILKKRSAEHSMRELRKEPEKFGSLGKQRAREGTIQAGYGGKGRD